MKIPERAPAALLSTEFLSTPGMVSKLSDVLKRAQNDYLYWDKFKQLPMPDGVSPAEAWAFVKLMRNLNSRPTAIPAADGHYTYVLTENALRTLHNIDKWAGGWDPTTIPHAPHDEERERYILSSLLEEAIASSQIEGASTTRRRAKEMLLNAEKPKDRGERMILNNYLTMKQISKHLDAPITPELLRELHETITTGTLPPEDVGVFRTTDDVVVADGVNGVLYTPPQAAEVPVMVAALCDYANREEKDFEHPAIKAIALHFWLALIHPFVDGNGRTARALFYLFMLKNNYWLFEYLAISRVILRRRAQYEKAYLYAEIDDSDFTYFLLFNLNAIETALKETRNYIDRKAAEDAEIEHQIEGDFGLNYRQRTALSRALKKPTATFTIQSHATSHGIVRATARTDLMDLRERGYLASHKRGRQVVFTAAPDLRERLTGR
ncbi:MAG: Fic family protein [Coriobacteriia bacterium]